MIIIPPTSYTYPLPYNYKWILHSKLLSRILFVHTITLIRWIFDIRPDCEHTAAARASVAERNIP